MVDNGWVMNVSEGHWVDRWPGHHMLFAENICDETHASCLELLMHMRGATGHGIVDETGLIVPRTTLPRPMGSCLC